MKIKRLHILAKLSTKKQIEKIGAALTVLDILVLLAIAGVTYFTVFSYYNAKIVKTEYYLKQFLMTLKVIHYLGLVALGHMVYSLIHLIYQKIKGKK